MPVTVLPRAVSAAGGSFNNVPSALLPEAARDGVSLPAGGTADPRADAEAGRVGPRQTNSTATANTIPPPPPLPPPASGRYQVCGCR